MGKASTITKPGKIPAQSAFNPFRQRLLLVIICFACYGNTLLNEYSLDDDFSVTENVYIQKGLSGIPEILTKPYYSDKTRQMDYRPLPGVTFAIENQLFGNNPHVSHFINTVLFALLILVIYLVSVEVFQLGSLHPFLPFIVAALYAVHPSHTEVVASIKNRDEILSFLFALLSLTFFNRFFTFPEKRYKMAAFTIALMLLSLFSKTVSLPMLGVIFLFGFYQGLKRKNNKAFYIFYACLLVFCFMCLAIIFRDIKRPMYDMENPLVGNTNFSDNVGTILETLFFYFKFMLVPYPPRFYYGFNMIPVVSITDPVAFFSFCIHLALLIFGLLQFRKKQLLGFFILGYLLNIAFYCNLIRYPGIVSERILFIPSLWFLAALALWLYNIGKFQNLKQGFASAQKLILAGIAGLAIIYIGLTINRNFQWKDRRTLMEADIPHLENSALGNYFYAGALMAEYRQTNSPKLQNEYLAKAKRYYRRTLKVAPVYPDAFFALGMIYTYNDPKSDSAFYYFYNGYLHDSKNNAMRFQLAKQYYQKADDVKAEQLLSQIYKELPRDTFTLHFYARTLFNLKKLDQAYEINNELMALAPYIPYPYVNLGIFKQNEGDFESAAENFDKAFHLGLRDQEIYNMLRNYYLQTNQTEKAAEIQKFQ